MSELTPEQIDAMPAGPEMDALVAEQVIGWVKLDGAPAQHSCPAKGLRGTWWERPDGRYECGHCNPPHGFSTDWSAMGEVVEKLTTGEKAGVEVAISVYDVGAHVEISHCNRIDKVEANGDTLPLAVCRAALKAAL